MRKNTILIFSVIFSLAILIIAANKKISKPVKKPEKTSVSSSLEIPDDLSVLINRLDSMIEKKRKELLKIRDFELVLSKSDSEYENSGVYYPSVYYIEPEDKYIMYYAGGSKNYPEYGNSICYAESKNGRDWFDRKEILHKEGSYQNIFHLFLVPENDNIAYISEFYNIKYRQWSRCISRGESADRQNFKNLNVVMEGTGKPDTWDAMSVLFPSVVFKDDRYFMYFITYYHTNDTWHTHLGMSESADGKNWSNRKKIESNADSKRVPCAPFVILTNDKKFKMFSAYTDASKQPGVSKVYQKTSIDGIKFSEPEFIFQNSDIAPYRFNYCVCYVRNKKEQKSYLYFDVADTEGLLHIARAELIE